MKKGFTFLVIFLMISTHCFSNISLPSIFSDNMVLQRNAEVKIWGWAKPGEEVKINTSWDENEYKTKADRMAYWEIILNTPDVRGTQELTLTGYNEVKLKNVLLGEVWLVSGQSNMEWSAAAGIDNGAEAIAGADNDLIRFFTVPHRTAENTEQDLHGTWVASTPETMKNFSAVAYFFGKKLNEELEGIPIGLINSSWGGTPAEVWMPAEAIENNEKLSKAASLLPDEPWGPNIPGALYNAMIAPLTNFKLAGVLWYQGESNTANADYYQDIFSTLIKSWREEWREEFPFFYAQIAPYEYGEGTNGVKIRDAQRRVQDLPKTGMIMTSDIGNIKDIHPRNKIDVGLRFANLALADVYGKNIKARGPVFGRIERDGKNVKVFFNNAEGLTFDEKDPVSQFEIAGEDKIFHPAKAEIKNGTVHLKSKAVKEPVYVRYSWGNTSTSNLLNGTGLPASSFTTEY